MSCSIGEFHMVHYQKMLKKYAYHRMLTCLPGKHECKELRRHAFYYRINNVMIERDYIESLKG